MKLLKSIEISNFMCFRKSQKIDFSNGTYLIGSNNAGPAKSIDPSMDRLVAGISCAKPR